MNAALDINPYLSSDIFVANNFIITDEEALDPLELLTFSDLMLMSNRVLTFYDCVQIDNDNDGMIDEVGTHDELISKRGRYFALYQQQESN